MKKVYSLLTLLLMVLLVKQGNTQTLAESFEGTFPPPGWKIVNAGTGPNNWAQYSSAQIGGAGLGSAQDGNFIAGYIYNSTNAANAWLITPAQTLTAGTSYTVSFYYKVGNTGATVYPEKLKVTVGTDTLVATQTTVLWNNNGGTELSNTTWVQGTTTYTPTTTGVYYFGFNAYSDPDQYLLMLDNIKIEQTAAAPPACTSVITPANGATNVNNYPSTTFKWNTVAGATAYDFYFGTTNPPPAPHIATTSADSIVLVNLNYSTTYYWYVVPKNSAGAATGCAASVASFTTQAAPPAPANDDCAGAATLSPTSQNGTTLGASESLPANDCGAPGSAGTANDDVWYTFTALSSGPVVVTVMGNGNFDAVVEAFTGSCGALTVVACIDTSLAGEREQLTINAMVGQTYRVRVFNWYSALSRRGSFSISASGAPLPITLVSFKGERIGTRNKLAWTTANENNNTGFHLERSVDGRSFSSISFVPTKAQNGNSSTSLQYEFSDVKPFASSSYYRLKQVDKDGKSSFSNIVLLKGQTTKALTLSSIYPNPAVNQLNIVATAPRSEKLNLIVTDLAGKVVMQQAVNVIAGDNLITLEVGGMPAGSYMIKTICETGCESTVSKFVKQ